MTTFSAPLPNNDPTSDSNHEEQKKTVHSHRRKNALREMLGHYTRINSITKGLIRIIGVIILAGIAVGIFELINRLT